MTKFAVLLFVLVLLEALCLTFPFSVDASPDTEWIEVGFEVSDGPPLTGQPPGTVIVQVNQRVEFTAIISGGTPPYTYQWSILPWNDDIMQMMFNCTYIEIPGATSSKFEYKEFIPGKYEICLNVNDSAGHTTFASGPIVDVQALPSQASNSSTSEPFPTLLVVAVAVAVVAVVAAGLLVYFKKRKP